MKNNMKKNFFWNIIGLTSYSFISLFSLIIVKLVNGISEAGIFTYAFSITTLFFYVSLYYNRTFQIANYNDSVRFSHYFTTRLLTSLLSLFLIIIFSIISNFNFYKIIIIILLMIFRIIDSISDCFYGYLQSNDKLYQVGISYTFKSIIGIILFFFVDFFTKNIIISLLCFLLTYFIVFLLYDLKCFKNIAHEKIKIDFSMTENIIKESTSVFIFSFLAMYLANCQKYVITYFSDNDLQTIFGILIMPATMLSLIGNYLIHPFINSLNEYRKNKKIIEFNRLTLKIIFMLFVFGIIALIIAYFVGIDVLNIIYQIDLKQYRFDLMIIIIAAILYSSSMIFSSVLTLLNINRNQIYLYLTSSIISTICCYFMAKNNIIRGSSFSYLIAAIINEFLFIIFYLKIINKLKKGEK